MSLSLAQQIENAMAVLLAGQGAPAPLDRAATLEYAHENMPAYNLAEMAAENEAARGTTDSLTVRGRWKVFCYAAGGEFVTPRAAVDPLLVYAHQQLQDSTLGGLCEGVVVEGYKCNYDRKGALPLVEVEMSLRVEYDITRGDPSQNYNA